MKHQGSQQNDVAVCSTGKASASNRQFFVFVFFVTATVWLIEKGDRLSSQMRSFSHEINET